MTKSKRQANNSNNNDNVCNVSAFGQVDLNALPSEMSSKQLAKVILTAVDKIIAVKEK